jgi:putative pyruvate formate lyase activating enzyme
MAAAEHMHVRHKRADAPWLHARAAEMRALLSPCRLCPHACGARRLEGETGACRLGTDLRVFCTNLHFGEEPPITATKGSGTVFFSGCNLRCVFCQNFAFSQLMNGEDMPPADLSQRMCRLQHRGAHNINWVTATAQAPFAVEALAHARADGLHIPLIYNSSGYESVEVLQALEGVVDVYLPDAKFAESAPAGRYSSAPDYPEVNRAALREMYRQVGPPRFDRNGCIQRGMIVRHLVLPGGAAGTRTVFEFLAGDLGRAVGVSLMHQYFPAHNAHGDPLLKRQITWPEWEEALECLDACEFATVYVQEWDRE